MITRLSSRVQLSIYSTRELFISTLWLFDFERKSTIINTVLQGNLEIMDAI